MSNLTLSANSPLLPTLIAESIYINSAHQRVIGLVKITKDRQLSSALDGKLRVVLIVTRSTRVRRIIQISQLIHFFLPFQISNHIRKVLFTYKNEGNNQTVENKV